LQKETYCAILKTGDYMKKKILFDYRDDILYLHHTLTLDPATDDFSFKSHSHNMVEVYYFLRGNAHFVVEGDIFNLERGNVLVMASGQTHHLLLEPSVVYERMALLIDTASVPASFDSLQEKLYRGAHHFVLTKNEQTWFEESFALIGKVAADVRQSAALSFANMVFSLLFTKLTPMTEPNIHDDSIKKAINYINKNLANPLSLESISGALYCSKGSLNRKFREIMGCTVWEYVIRRRIYSARQYLSLGGSLSDAYQKSGFCDYSSFFRAYKKVVGISPSADMKKLKAN